MTKTKLETFIKKYSLGNTLDAVRWTVKDGILKVGEMTSDKKLLASVEMNNFDAFKDAEFVVRDTPRLKALLAGLEENITIDLTCGDDNKDRIILATVSDNDNRFEYNTGADADDLPPKPKIMNIPSYDVEIVLNEKFVNSFSKGKSALSEVNLFTLVMNKKKKLEMVIGYSSNINTDRYILGLNTIEGKDTIKEPISFSANVLKEILAANSEVKDPVLKVSEQGLAYIEFVNDDFKAKYYMIKIPVED